MDYLLDKIISDSSDVEFLSSSEAEDMFHKTMIKITKEDLKKSIGILVNNHWQNPDKLPEGHAVLTNYRMVSLTYLLIDDKGKKDINEIISKQYRPININPGTVGSFLFGCASEDYGEVDKHCSPLCKDAFDSRPCHKQMWAQSGERPRRFIRLNNSSNKQAYVYIDDDFTGFTPDEVADFKQGGVDVMTVLTTKNNKHYTMVNQKPLSDVPIEILRTEQIDTPPTLSGRGSSNLAVYILVAVVVIAVILVFKSRP